MPALLLSGGTHDRRINNSNYLYSCSLCGVICMSEYNWCHGPECHTRVTVDRVRGVKGKKVLRTRKIKITNWNKNNGWQYFCSQGCWNDFFHKFSRECRNIAPRNEPLETPIEDPKKTRVVSSWNPNHSWNETQIKVIDNAAQ